MSSSTHFLPAVCPWWRPRTELKNLDFDGFQRRRFLPAIELLERHGEILHMDGGTDHRLRALEQAELYYTPSMTVPDVLCRQLRCLAPDNRNEMG